MTNRGEAWDERINLVLNKRFGLEKFDNQKVSLSFEEKANYFELFRQAFEDRNIDIITVAGTNGKGETSRNLNKRLIKLGKNTALWTSPHVLSVRERFIYNDQLINEAVFENLLKMVPSELSFYEGLFYLFCSWVVHLEKIDVVILEVGLGGRLDAVNYFDADLVCLTSISRDHTEYLGDSLTEILKEKLGVCRGNAPLVSCLSSKHLNSEIQKFVNQRGIYWINLDESAFNIHKMPYWEQNMLTATIAEGVLTHGAENFKWKDVATIDPPHESPGRFEMVTLKNRRFIFIGAHNLDGLRQLVQSVFQRVEITGDLKCLMGFSSRPLDDIDSMIDVIFSCPRISKSTLVCTFDHPRSISSEVLLSLMERRKKEGKENLKFVEDWKNNIDEGTSGTTLVFGSYYFIGEFQKYIFSSYSAQ